MRQRPLPTIDRLRELLEIDSAGVLRWRVSRGRVRAGQMAFTACMGSKAGSYFVGSIDNQNIPRSRVVFALNHGRWPVGEVRHMDGDPTNDEASNLADAWTDPRGLSRRRSDGNESPFLGVRQTEADTWEARRWLNRRYVKLGTYPTPEDAARAYDAAARRDGSTYGQLLNFPEAQP